MYISSNDIKMKHEARLLAYELLYIKNNRQLVTQRTTTDISSLEKYFTKEEYITLRTTLSTATRLLDEVHNRIEADLNARKA